MPRRTLLDFYADLSTIPGEFVVYDDGYRSWSYTYAEIAAAAGVFASRLRAEGIGKGQTVAIWGENRAEWIVALWGCLLEGVVLVPIDYRASADFLLRVAAIVDARAVLAGDAVDAGPIGADAARLAVVGPAAGSLRRHGHGRPTRTPSADITADTTAEIIFTSGATAEPKGVVITHRNILANIVPIEREMANTRSTRGPFLPIRFLNLLPLSHMFGQAMATFVPPMLPGVVVFTRTYAPEDIVRQIHERRVSVLVCVPKMLDVLREHVLRVAPEAADAPATMHWMKRWWRYRRMHSMFGFKFWALVVGAAPLDPELEEFWGRLGFVGHSGIRPDRDGADRDAEPSAPCGPGRRRQADRRRRSARSPRMARSSCAARTSRAGTSTPPEETRAVVRGRLVPYRRHRRARRQGTAAHPRAQEGNDRDARGIERLSGRRRARAERARRRPRVGRRRRDAAGIDSGTRAGGRRRRPGHRLDDLVRAGERGAPGSSEDPRRVALARRRSCRAPRARAS